jgi:hypothetical protein
MEEVRIWLKYYLDENQWMLADFCRASSIPFMTQIYAWLNGTLIPDVDGFLNKFILPKIEKVYINRNELVVKRYDHPFSIWVHNHQQLFTDIASTCYKINYEIDGNVEFIVMSNKDYFYNFKKQVELFCHDDSKPISFLFMDEDNRVND